VEKLRNQTRLLNTFFLKLSFLFLTVVGTLTQGCFTTDINSPLVSVPSLLHISIPSRSQPVRSPYWSLWQQTEDYLSGMWASSVHCNMIS